MTTTSDSYVMCAGTPSVEVYLRLRSGSGLSPKTPEMARAGLPGTWHGVTVLHDGEPVGMGRVIGDGGCFFQIVDMCVLPGHQGRGLGRRIMEELVGELERRAPDGAYVSLIADGDARFLYEKFGFSPTAPASVGMHRTV
ncbi:GNAT family N-acetyltransferase [Streptomyces sp. NPDC006512]|uniref:GNAT family N-acetyltransferase n=1 Tax=Streptomyces sp. NPDC006512 TaxID=3154307 RepID=UPI00339FD452